MALGVLGYFIFNHSGDNVMTGSRKFVTFNTVKNATSYSVEVDNERSASYVVKKDKVADKDNCFQFVVSVSVGDKKVAEESYLQEIEYQRLGTNKIDCKIKNYTIIFFDDDQNVIQNKTVHYIDQELKNVDDDIFCVVVSEYFDDIFVNDGTYTIKFTPFEGGNEIKDENGKSLSVTEEMTYRAFYKNDFLRRGEFFYGGKWLDYVVESKEELVSFVWRSILYRQSGVNFYVNTNEITSSNINSLVFDAIEDYPEYNAVNDLPIYAVLNGNVATLSNFTYYLPENFTKDSSKLDMNKLSDEQKARVEESRYEIYDQFEVPYIEKTAGERHFAIDEERADKSLTTLDKRRGQSGNYVADEVVVYNTEQLFMVVQNGGRPVFVEGKSDVAKAVYENALAVLKRINNSDELSEYEKALNIYNYLTGEIVYDWTIYSYMEEVGSFLVSDFGEYSCFYLEGVFYDFGSTTHYAVCDGLAKAYSLMCNIEGIECEKVNGAVSGGQHAWNRVSLKADAERNLEAGHYYVDCTWGEGRLEDNSIAGESKKYQFLTHTYFLFKQDDKEREIYYPIIELEDSKDYGYYKNTKIECEKDGENIFVDLYIENNDDFDAVIIATYNEYKASEKTSNYVEMMIDKNYSRLWLDDTVQNRLEYLARTGKISANYKYIKDVSDNLLFVIFGE